LILGFFTTETSEYQIHTKFRLSGNWRNSRSFGQKLIAVYGILRLFRFYLGIP
jgi:hypothetical protein